VAISTHAGTILDAVAQVSLWDTDGGGVCHFFPGAKNEIRRTSGTAFFGWKLRFLFIKMHDGNSWMQPPNPSYFVLIRRFLKIEV
jgi:hypothetical protein